MRTLKKIKNEIKKLQNKRTGLTMSKKHPGILQEDGLGNRYRIVDGRRELINEPVLKQEIQKQEQAIKAVESRPRRSKKKAAAPTKNKSKKKEQGAV